MKNGLNQNSFANSQPISEFNLRLIREKDLYKKIKTITKSKDCFECRGCCYFEASECAQAPIMMDWELPAIKKIFKSLPIKKFRNSKKVFQFKLKESQPKDGPPLAGKTPKIFVCPFLNEKTQSCKIYQARPLDCQIWPFLFLRDKKGRAAVACLSPEESDCLAIKKIFRSDFDKYAKYLKAILEKLDYKELIKKYPEIIWNWEEGFIVAWVIK